ncbi:MAG: sulfite exporter TauE/SafE family protein [Planctomycetota bacterium]|nr:sulfite exporter TauE/SafE family protein [Planctomycetota bacterium]
MSPLRHAFSLRVLKRLRLFLLWLGAFYTAWLIILLQGDNLAAAIHQWRIAVAMALGSYFAGSTPMGGGTVGFPFLVLLFDQPASVGRNFSLAVQSVGMVSASIFIFVTRRTLAWSILSPALIASLITTPLALAFIAPYAPPLLVKLLFAVIWASFGVMHFVRLREITAMHGHKTASPRLDLALGVSVGLVGGILSAITGVGIDMLIYAVLVTLLRTDLKIAIPTSVVIMAFTSLVGITSSRLLGQVEPEVFPLWLAAAPVVALGAPFGALVVHFMPRKPTLLIVSALCIGQYIWTLIDERVTGWPLLLSLFGVLAFNALFHIMYRAGESLAARNGPAPHAVAPTPSI